MVLIASTLSRFASIFALLVTPVFATVITFDDGTTSRGPGRSDLFAEDFVFPGGFLESAASGGVPGSGQYVGSAPTDVSTGFTYLDMATSSGDPFTLDSLDLAQLFPSNKLPDQTANAPLVYLRGFRLNGSILKSYLQPTQNFVTYKFTGWTGIYDISFLGSVAGSNDYSLEPFFALDNITVEPHRNPARQCLQG